MMPPQVPKICFYPNSLLFRLAPIWKIKYMQIFKANVHILVFFFFGPEFSRYSEHTFLHLGRFMSIIMMPLSEDSQRYLKVQRWQENPISLYRLWKMWPVQAHNTLSTIVENIKINQTSKKKPKIIIWQRPELKMFLEQRNCFTKKKNATSTGKEIKRLFQWICNN